MELRGVGNAGLARAVTLPAAALLALTALRLVMSAILPLAPDEAYYWIWSRAPAAGYLDHPPMVALWIALGVALAGETPFGVRLLGPFAAALGAVLIADATERLLPGRRAGVVAAGLLNATLFLGVGSIVMTPDSPLLLFWTATLWALVRVLGARDGRTFGWWVLAGLCGGLALVSKYTAAFLGIGIGSWLVLTRAMWPQLRRPGPWVGLAVALAVFAPVLAWNADHGWAGIIRQGGRVTDWHPGRALQFLGELIGGQAGLATPLVWVACLGGIVLAARHAWRGRDRGWLLLALLTAPATLYFLWYALGARVQGNWPAIIYPAAAIAAAALVGPVWQRLHRPAKELGLGVTLLAYLHGITGALPLPVRVDPIALRLADWDRVAAAVEHHRRDAGAAFVVADQYALAAELAWILPSHTPVIGAEDRWRLFDLPRPVAIAPVGILVRDSRELAPMDTRLWQSVTLVGSVARQDVQTLHLFRVVATGAVAGLVTLPRRLDHAGS